MTNSKSLGFIGTGTIAAAIIQGLCRETKPHLRITVSPRNDETARDLALRFHAVTVGSDNQDVVDRSDVLFLAVRPEIAEEVVRSLRFPAGKLLVSLVATLDLERLRSWINGEVRFVRALPLPFVADGYGVTMVAPPDDDVLALFSQCGRAVGCSSTSDFEILTTTSALMGTYFGLLERLVGWAQSQGLDPQVADDYLRSLTSSLAARSSAFDNSSFKKLRTEFSTKGGLNEQIFRDFEAGGGRDALLTAMSMALARVRRGTKSDTES